MEVRKEYTKRIIFFIYISIVIHFYIFLLLNYFIDKEIIDMLKNPEKYVNKSDTTIENIILNTKMESKIKPNRGKISDKMNIDKALNQGNEFYNYLNPDIKEKNSDNKLENSEDNNKKTDIKNIQENNNIYKNENMQNFKDNNFNKSYKVGDYHTSYFDLNKPLEITSTTKGDFSIATMPIEYANYFINMKNKISENWGKFFPVFQYYQGLLKPGEIIVNFEIDKEGNVKNLKLVKSYGYNILDQSCINAIYHSKNFGPIPNGLLKEMEASNKEYLSISFKFIYVDKN